VPQVARIKKYEFDCDTAAVVCKSWADAWENRTYGFANMHPPEIRHQPKEIEYGSLMHAMYLFFVGWNNRSGKTAEKAISQCSTVCLDHPEVLNPATGLAESYQDELRRILTPIIPFAHTDPKRINWWRNTLKLLEKYDGDPRILILRNLNLDQSPMENRDRLIKVMTLAGKHRDKPVGMKHKIAQLILLWLQDIQWKGNDREWEFFRQIPFYCVDIWIMRLVYQFGMIKSFTYDKRDGISEDLSEDLSLACHNAGLSCYDSNQGAWHIGNGLCQWRPKTSALAAERHCALVCPSYELCQCHVPPNKENHSRGSMCYDLAVPHPTLDLGSMYNGMSYREYATNNFRNITVSKKGARLVSIQDTKIRQHQILDRDAIGTSPNDKIRPPKNRKSSPKPEIITITHPTLKF